jgi:hypothetical protein
MLARLTVSAEPAAVTRDKPRTALYRVTIFDQAVFTRKN